jgi:hypothetical protein
MNQGQDKNDPITEEQRQKTKCLIQKKFFAVSKNKHADYGYDKHPEYISKSSGRYLFFF